jgi:uncharacterized protein YbbK (DUF523 family)/uncharacterized protein YbgA (DUF1722 family)
MGAVRRAGPRLPERRLLGADAAPIRIGVSACLLGREVRWDGGHRRDSFLVDELGPFVEWVPVCPEVELGMGVPRETVRLVARGDRVRLLAERSGVDHSSAMRAWARRRVCELAALELSGYVLKKDSPSCGLERVPVWSASGGSERRGRGLFAEALLGACEALPIEDEDRLHDARLRENWIERIFAYRRLRWFFDGPWTPGTLASFHAAHELQLRAHAPAAHRALGRLVARAGSLRRAAARRTYERGFMAALRRPATPARHVEVLKRAVARFRGRLDLAGRRALLASIDDYRAGRVPLVVPIALVRHHVARLGAEELGGQVYLEPHPKELMLRNRA